ncbi:MAG TPA: group I intron-associated PD-(D/E)XK endonuclease [Ktedonosporobacter sp.]|nr:group I intron-associated PD-(D/E)XK endonuclease [Ktedonosporobacter sp.]
MIEDGARKGLAAHLAIAQRLIELGFEVLEPVGNHLRYDLAYYVCASPSEKAQLVRVQCKSARLSIDKTCLIFNAYNLGGEGRRQKRGYRGEVEYFGVYSPDTRKVYLIDVDKCPVGETTLRLEPTGKQGENQFSIRARWAKDYEV